MYLTFRYPFKMYRATLDKANPKSYQNIAIYIKTRILNSLVIKTAFFDSFISQFRDKLCL